MKNVLFTLIIILVVSFLIEIPIVTYLNQKGYNLMPTVITLFAIQAALVIAIAVLFRKTL